MKRVLVHLLAVLAILATVIAAPATSTPSTSSRCASTAAADATCFAKTAKNVTGLSPANIRSAYALVASAGKGRTVAIVSAYNDPTAESDLAVYRKTFKLAACTSANGCFRKVNQTGGTTAPKTNAAWAGETSLDIEMVSAACPKCKILLVQASTASMANLAAAENYAATQGVSAISNSWGSSDYSHAAAFDHPGIAVVAAVGDSGYGAGAPAAYSTVIAVGGTTLTKANNARGWTEKAWISTGSLCASATVKPSWQTTATKCAGKAVSDVSAVADPNTGVAVYTATKYAGVKGWQVFGGTSVAAPIIAAVYAMSGRTAGYPAAYTWAHRAGLNDVTKGSNGSCATKIWCRAAKGWDGPTGLGTPHGTSSF